MDSISIWRRILHLSGNIPHIHGIVQLSFTFLIIPNRSHWLFKLSGSLIENPHYRNHLLMLCWLNFLLLFYEELLWTDRWMEFSDRYYTIIWEENHCNLLVISTIYVLILVYFQTNIGQAIWLHFTCRQNEQLHLCI